MTDDVKKESVMNENSGENNSESNLFSARHWQRLVFMLIFAVLLHLASLTMWVLVTLQFLFSIFTGQDNKDLRSLGAAISVYIHDTLDFLTYNTEEKPFPFSPWPSTCKTTEEDKALTKSVESDPQH